MAKALTLKQPWAWLVIGGPKDIENRCWNTKFRGRFYVHTSRTHDLSEYERAQRVCDELGVELPPFGSSVYLCGGIIGSAVLTSVLPREDTQRWKFQGQYGFVLKDRTPLSFAPCAGALNFWRIPESIERAFEAA